MLNMKHKIMYNLWSKLIENLDSLNILFLADQVDFHKVPVVRYSAMIMFYKLVRSHSQLK